MLRSLYVYKGTHARTLAFGVNEKFIEIGISRDPNWVHVISENGSLGYVPKNYVAIDEATPIKMLEVIDACIEGIHLAASEKGGNYSRFEHEALQALVEKRQEWHSKIPPALHPSKRPAPPPPNRTSSQLSVDSLGSTVSDGSLPSPSQPSSLTLTFSPPSSAPTPTSLPPSIPPAPSPTPSTTFPGSGILQPKRQSSEVEASTSFIGRGNSVDAVEEDVNNCLENLSLNTLNGKPSTNAKAVNHSETMDADIREMIKLIPKGYCRQLVEEIRSRTNVSFSTSHQVVNLVFQSLQTTFPGLGPLLKEILDNNKNGDICDGVMEASGWEGSSDGRKLVDLLETLRKCKDDDQQRSWALHEDEFTIKEHLNDLLEILLNGDLEVCNQVLLLDDHRPLLTLVQYYQMETRWNLRKLLLQIFTNICQMSSKNISFLSSSVLPLELTREILDPKTSQDEMQYTSLVLGMILSMGDTLPFTHFSIMNESFVRTLLQGIESFNSNPETESLGELFMTLLLAFNLQYHASDSVSSSSHSTKAAAPSHNDAGAETENLVIRCLSLQKETKYFIEKILLLFNREEDPVRIFNHEPCPPHSVLCLMVDVFHSPLTAQLLYTNDEKVLCDIILRQLTDLPPEDKRRREYLCLLEGVVKLGRWKEHRHRRKELTSRLQSILAQEEFPWDRIVAQRILTIPDLLSDIESY